MTVPYLPNDCIYDILKHLQNYRSTLFNCLLVNRFLCKSTIPLLYADPFEPFNKITHNCHSIILTLILCLNKTEISQLINQLKLNKINYININDEHKPLFEYPKYLKNYDCFYINFVIFKWLRVSCQRRIREKLYENFIPTFHQSLLHQCNNINQLNIPARKNYNIQTFAPKLISLSLKDIDNEISPEFLNNIANVCLNLKKLEILETFSDTSSNDIIKEKLCAIIQKQNNLKIIKISSDCQSFLNDILLSLNFQKHFLVFIEFKKIDFNNISFKNLINLCNLKCLKFYDCKEVSLDQCEILYFASFKLKELVFGNNSWNDDIMLLMIKHLGASLEELLIDVSLKVPIIENILIYCSNLITLEVGIIDLLACSYFENLKIRNLNINDNCKNDNAGEMFKRLANNLPTNVKEISLDFNNILHLEEFLENCHDCLETINLNDCIDSIDLKVILNYIERGNNDLKFLGVYKLERILNDEGSKLLNQIKGKGVKIVDFNNTYKNDALYF